MSDTADPTPAEPAPEEPHVEIHKLKPIHSWRDFLKELGTIVLGIIIAITLEHLVEEWSWDREVKVARQALMAEVSNNTRSLAFRVAVEPCVNRLITETDAVLTALEAGRSTGGVANFNYAFGGALRDSEWQSERASQVLTHFPRAELALLSYHYGQLDDLRHWMAQESDVWATLDALRNPRQELAESDLMRLRSNLVIAQSLENRIVVNSRRQLRNSEKLGGSALSADPVLVKNYCTMSIEEFRRYRSTQDLR